MYGTHKPHSLQNIKLNLINIMVFTFTKSRKYPIFFPIPSSYFQLLHIPCPSCTRMTILSTNWNYIYKCVCVCVRLVLECVQVCVLYTILYSIVIVEKNTKI